MYLTGLNWRGAWAWLVNIGLGPVRQVNGPATDARFTDFVAANDERF